MADWSAFDDFDVRVPGVVVGVASGARVVTSASFGAATPGGERLDVRSVFYVASVAKQFTAAAVAALVVDGVVSLDDSIRRWIPELSAAWDEVHLAHLLAHTGGLPDSNPIDGQVGWGVNSTFTTWDRVAHIAGSEPVAPPGTVHRYSNHGYVLLAAAVERASGRTLGAFAREELFTAAGMAHSRFLDVDGLPPVPGWTGGRERVDIAFSCCGDGGLVTSIADLAAWNAWLPISQLAPMMLGARSRLPDGQVAHDAWGISIRTHRGLRIESHGGSIDGYLASFIRFPTENLAIIALANTDAPGADEFGRRLQSLTDSLLGDRLDPDKPAWNETHHDTNGYSDLPPTRFGTGSPGRDSREVKDWHGLGSATNHLVAEQVLGNAGWKRCGSGDWAIALCSPDRTLAARVSPFDPTGPMTAELYRQAAFTGRVPRLWHHVRLEGGGDLLVMEHLQPASPADAAAFLADIAADAPSLRDFVMILRRVHAQAAARLPWCGPLDTNPANVMQRDDGTIVLTDPFYADGPKLYSAALDDPERVARLIPPTQRRYIAEIPLAVSGPWAQGEQDRIRAALAAADASRLDH